MVKQDEKKLGLVKLIGCRCRCGHEWLPRHKDEIPRVCPKCKSPNWDKPLREKKALSLSEAYGDTEHGNPSRG